MHPEEYEDYFFNRLIKLRMKKGNSARDMSLSMGQNKGYMANIESKKSFPSLPMFFVICDYLGVTPMEFFNSENEIPVEITNLTKKAYLLNEKEIDLITELVDTITHNRQNFDK